MLIAAQAQFGQHVPSEQNVAQQTNFKSII